MAQVVGGVQAPKYIYLPNATIRYNKLNYTYEKTTTFNDTYTRPSEWLTLPTVNPGDEVVYMLVSVYEDTPSYVGFAVNGDFTVDWGDGNIIDYDSTGGISANNRVNYSFDWNNLDPSTLTSEGYRHAIVKITPQVPGTLTKFDIYNAYQSPFGINYSNILDIKMAGQNINYLRIGGNYNRKLEQFEFVGSHSITNGSSIFYQSKIKKLVSFDMTNVTNGTTMFYYCSNLIELPQGFDTSNLTSCYQMFRYCTSLEKVSLDLTSCTDVRLMFANCNELKEVNLQNTSNVTSFQQMFLTSAKLETVNGLDTSSGTNFYQLFSGCGSLIDVPELNLQNATSCQEMFAGCSSIIRFENGLLNTSGVTNMKSMFSNCSSLIEIPKDFNTDSVTNMQSMFYACSSLRFIPNINTSNVTNMSTMFYSSGIIGLPEGFDTSNVTTFNQTFEYCRKLKSLPTLDLSSNTTLYLTFRDCNELKEVNLQNTSNVTNFQQTFLNCGELETVNGFDVSSGTNFYQTFTNCYLLKNLPLLNLQNATNCYNMFGSCSSLEGFTNGLLNTSGVTNMQSMFNGCSSLKEIPSDFNTDSCVGNGMRNLFQGTSSLKTIPNINTAGITNGQYMFYQSGIEVIPPLDFSNVTYAYSLFDRSPSIRTIGSIDLSNLPANQYILRDNWGLSESNIIGYRYTHTYYNGKLSRLGLINIFNNLGNATSQTIDVRNNPGTSELTPEDIAIATSKGWTVTV